jgi:HAD superfamily hydrolase (TIGR01549 family)
VIRASVRESQNTYLSVVAALHSTGLSDRHAAAVLHAMDVPALGVIEPFSGAKHLLGTIQGLGMRCAIFSNATWRSTASYWRDFRAFSLAEYIDEIISSVDLGARKPSLRMFHAAVHAAERPPQECVVVGDSEERDIAPGVRLGMRALRVAIDRPRPTHTAAHAVVTSLRDAATTLLRWKEASDAT